MCGGANNGFSHAASQRSPARCLKLSDRLRSLFTNRVLPCREAVHVYVPVLAEHTYLGAYSIRLQYMHTTTGGEFEYSSVSSRKLWIAGDL